MTIDKKSKSGRCAIKAQLRITTPASVVCALQVLDKGTHMRIKLTTMFGFIVSWAAKNPFAQAKHYSRLHKPLTFPLTDAYNFYASTKSTTVKHNESWMSSQMCLSGKVQWLDNNNNTRVLHDVKIVAHTCTRSLITHKRVWDEATLCPESTSVIDADDLVEISLLFL